MSDDTTLRSFKQIYNEATQIKEQLIKHLENSKPWPQNIDAINIVILRIEFEEILFIAKQLHAKLIKNSPK